MSDPNQTAITTEQARALAARWVAWHQFYSEPDRLVPDDRDRLFAWVRLRFGEGEARAPHEFLARGCGLSDLVAALGWEPGSCAATLNALAAAAGCWS